MNRRFKQFPGAVLKKRRFHRYGFEGKSNKLKCACVIPVRDLLVCLLEEIRQIYVLRVIRPLRCRNPKIYPERRKQANEAV